MKYSERDQAVSVVFVGQLNPMIFQPSWFALHDLIRPSEAETAEVEIIHPDVVSFKTEWFDLSVQRQKFTLRTSQEPYSQHLFDLAVGTFRRLIHTPAMQLGINRNLTYEFDSVEDWHGLGHFLAPKHAWKQFMKEPGLKAMTITTPRDDDIKGGTNVTVEAKRPPIVVFSVNDHYEVKDQTTVVGCKEMLEVLEKKFFQSVSASKLMIESILEIYADSRNPK